MKRQSRQPVQPKPVQKVEVSEKHVKLRIVLFVVFALIAVGALAFGLVQCLSVDSGWYEITATDSADSCASEFSFTYYIDDDMGKSGKTDLERLYALLCQDAYKQFNSGALFDGVNNLARIGFERNNDIVVSTELYEALKLMTAGGNRYVFRAPIYSIYRALFTCLDDNSAREFDPYYNATLAEDIAAFSTFTESAEHVGLEFKGENTVRLFVSDEYYSFATERGVTAFLDAFALENAFMLDHVADGLTARGYKRGTIASRDGYARDLDSASGGSDAVVFDIDGTVMYAAAKFKLNGGAAVVSLNKRARNAPFGHYYSYADGTCRTPFLGVDGFNAAATGNLLAYSYEKNCAEIAVKAVAAYCADTPIAISAQELKASGILSAYCEDRVIKYNDGAATVTASVFEDREYSAEQKE